MDLREYRKNLNLSQSEAAIQAGLSAPAFCSAELGTRFPEPDTILKIMAWSKKRGAGPAVTANDLLQAWCLKHEKKYPSPG